MELLTDERCHHCKRLPECKQDLNLDRACAQTSLNEVVQEINTTLIYDKLKNQHKRVDIARIHNKLEKNIQNTTSILKDYVKLRINTLSSNGIVMKKLMETVHQTVHD